MKLFDFSNISKGWPYTASTFKYIQEQLLELQALSLLGGSLYVVAGCNDVAGIVQDGFVCINGEILPFVGGAVQPYVVIVEAVSTKRFKDNSINDYQKVRTATFGTDVVQYDWSTFENKNITKGVMQRMREAETEILATRSDLNNLTVAFNLYQPDWADITNKPSGLISYVGRKVIGNVAGGYGGEITVDIPDQTNTNYKVIGNLVYLSGSGGYSTDTMVTVSDFKSPTQFKIWVREFEDSDQDLAFDYIIVKL